MPSCRQRAAGPPVACPWVDNNLIKMADCMTDAELHDHQQRSAAWGSREAAAHASWEALLRQVDGPSAQEALMQPQQDEGRCWTPPPPPPPMQPHGRHAASPTRRPQPPQTHGQRPGRRGQPAAGAPSPQQHGDYYGDPRRGYRPASPDRPGPQQGYQFRPAPRQQAPVYGPSQQQGPRGEWPPGRLPVQPPMHAPGPQQGPVPYGPNAQQQGFCAPQPSYAGPAMQRPPHASPAIQPPLHAAPTQGGPLPVPMGLMFGRVWPAPGEAPSTWVYMAGPPQPYGPPLYQQGPAQRPQPAYQPGPHMQGPLAPAMQGGLHVTSIMNYALRTRHGTDALPPE